MARSACWSVLVCAAALSGCSADVFDPTLGLVDRDGDGWVDADEQELGSDPDNPYEWDFGSGEWPDFTDEAAKGTAGADFGYRTGNIVPDFLSTDQYGNKVPLHTFYGYVILLDFVAGWCDPCRDVALGSQDVWVEHRLDGVIIIHMVIDDDDWTDPSVEAPFQRGWADQYGIDFPVLYDADIRAYNGFLNEGELTTGYIPFTVVLDDQMRIVDGFEGSDKVAEAEALALELARQRDAR